MFVIYNVWSRQFVALEEHPVACEHIVVLDWVR